MGRFRLGAAAAVAAAVAGAGAFSGCAGARAATPPGAHDPVPGHPGVTYLDLLREVVPDLADNADDKDVEGHLAGPMRHLAGKDYEGDPPDPVVLSYIEDVRFKAGGKPRIALMADLGPDPDRAYNTALLALYDDSPKPKLLDYADVGVDRDVSFSEQTKLALGPNDDALVTYSEHFNTSMTYSGRLLVYVRQDHWRLIENLFTLAERACGWEREETPTWSVAPDPGSRFNRIKLVVKDVRTRTEGDCDETPPKPYARTYRASWRWDASRGDFVGQAQDLQRLAKANAAEF